MTIKQRRIYSSRVQNWRCKQCQGRVVCYNHASRMRS